LISWSLDLLISWSLDLLISWSLDLLISWSLDLFHFQRFASSDQAFGERVQALAMSPQDDSFLSSSEDGTIRLWDIRSQMAQGLMRTQTNFSTVTYDPSGLVFAVGIRNTVSLYDRRNFQSGSLLTSLSLSKSLPLHKSHNQTDD